LLTVKAGDLQVHIAGAIAFFALGLHRLFPRDQKIPARIREFICWVVTPFSVILAGSQNRGGLLAVLTVIAMIVAFRPMSRMNRLILPLILVGMVLTATDFRIQRPGERDYSMQQIIMNVQKPSRPRKLAQPQNTRSPYPGTRSLAVRRIRALRISCLPTIETPKGRISHVLTFTAIVKTAYVFTTIIAKYS